jgi:putative phage-type endonuclease
MVLAMSKLDEYIEQNGNAKLIGYFENQSNEWLQARAGIGGSDIGTILGVNQYKTRHDLLNEKRFGAPPLIPNLAMRMGTKFEAPIRELWVENNAQWLEVHETGTWQHKDYPEYKANPDGIIRYRNGQLALLEIKFSQARELPETWYYQTQWYMSLLGLETCILVQCSGNKLLEHKIEHSLDAQTKMFAAAQAFTNEMRNI